MARSLKDTINGLKVRRQNLRDKATTLRTQAKELEDQAYGLTEAIDALEPWANNEVTARTILPDPEGRHRPDPASTMDG